MGNLTLVYPLGNYSLKRLFVVILVSYCYRKGRATLSNGHYILSGPTVHTLDKTCQAIQTMIGVMIWGEMIVRNEGQALLLMDRINWSENPNF